MQVWKFSCRFLLPQWIDPLQAGEAVEVPVGAVDHGGMFPGVKGDQRVRAQIASHSGVFEQCEECGEGALRNLDDACVGAFEPPINDLSHLSHSKGIHSDVRVSHQPREDQNDDPRNTDGFRSG